MLFVCAGNNIRFVTLDGNLCFTPLFHYLPINSEGIYVAVQHQIASWFSSTFGWRNSGIIRNRANLSHPETRYCLPALFFSLPFLPLKTAQQGLMSQKDAYDACRNRRNCTSWIRRGRKRRRGPLIVPILHASWLGI
jgi:hypothetical protein